MCFDGKAVMNENQIEVFNYYVWAYCDTYVSLQHFSYILLMKTAKCMEHFKEKL